MGRAAAAAAAVFTTLLMSVSSPAEPAGGANSAPALQAGDVAVTGFPGTTLATDKLPPGVDPIDRTFIDPNGPSLRVFAVSSLNGAPAGQLLNVPPRLGLPAKDVGQVFALAVDPGTNGGPPNLFAAATSAFGLSVVGAGRAADGKPVRLKSGAPDATFMEGQFGALSSDSPGAIYKIDGATGAATYIADTAFSGVLNTGAGIGGLAYDPTSRALYASDLDSGLIHRFGLDYNAADLGQFDHGVAGRRASGLPEVADDGKRLDLSSDAFKADDPGTWGFTQPQRRVDALSVHDGRLYYAVAEGPEIWSVGLNAVGAFLTDARREVVVKAEKPFPVTAITFDAGGNMLLAQRSPVKSPYDFGSFTDTDAQVLRYSPKLPDDKATPDLWKSDPATYAVGAADKGNAGSGGVSLQYGYKPDGSIDLGTCEGSVAFTGDTLGTNASGVQLNGIGLVRPQNDPPSQSAFIDYDTNQEDPGVRGHVGSVAAVRLCGAAAGFPPVEAGMPPVEEGGAAPPVEGGGGGGGAFPPVDEGGGGAGGGTVGGGETFPPIDEGGGGTTTDQGGGGGTQTGPIVVVKKGPTNCPAKGPCAFTISVTNNSDAEIKGPILIDEQIDAPQASLSGAPNSPWTCTKTQPFVCTHPGPLAANQSIDLNVTFSPNTAAGTKQIKNCAVPRQPADDGQGGAAPGQQPQNLAPKKKSELWWHGGGSPLLVPVTFRLQDILKPQSLVRTVADDFKECLAWKPPSDFLIRQSNDIDVSIKDFKVDENGKVISGTATYNYTDPNDDLHQIRVAHARVTGSLDGPKIHLLMDWDFGDPNKINSTEYNGAISFIQDAPTNPNGYHDVSMFGRNLGINDGARGATTDFSTWGPKFKCAKDQFCLDYANAAVAASREAQTQKCGLTGARWTQDVNSHLDWCMAQSRGAGSPIEAEAAARSQALAACADKNAHLFKPVDKLGVHHTNEAANGDALAPEQCVVVPIDDDQQAGGGKGGPVLSIKKSGPTECSELAGCDFRIEVTNDGDADFNGQLDINEEVTLDGKPAPEILGVPKGTWKCTQAGSAFTCSSLPNVTLGPKGTQTLFFHVASPKLTGAKTMENCANVVGQAAKPCVKANLTAGPKGPKFTIKKEAIDGTCDPFCTFRITVTNIGSEKVLPPLSIIDFLQNVKTSSNGVVSLDIDRVGIVGGGDADCAKISPTGAINCDIKSAIEPGKDVTIDLSVKSNTPEFTADNCISRRDKSTADPESLMTCVPIVGPRHRGPNLVIDKEAPNAAAHGDTGHCGLKEFCTFTITVKNIGDAPFTGVLHLTDSVGPGTPVRIFKGNGFGTCDEAQNTQGAGGFANNSIKCDVGPFPEGIRPDDQVQLQVIVVAGEKWGSGKNLQNCAELTADADMGPAETPKKDCADVKLDPFDVDVAKTGDQNCKPGGECRFDIDIFNPNDAVTHDDPVTVTDKLSGLSSAQIVSITPQAPAQDFPCKPQPTQIPFTCSGHMKLRPGDHNHYTMIIRLPADASAASFSNCATVGGARSSDDSSDPSCHSVQLAPPEQPFSLKIDKTGPASCKPGAECPFDLTLTNTGANDHAGGVTITDGLSNAPPMTIVSIEPPLPCAAQPAEIPFNCKTAEDFTLPAGGKRTFKVTARVPRSADATFTNCAILASATAPKTGGVPENAVSSCHTVSVSTPPTQTREKPECKGGMVLMDEGVCACPAGTQWNGRACAVPPRPVPSRQIPPEQPPPVCKGDRPVGTFPNCCPVDTHFDRAVNPPRGACVSDGRGGASGINQNTETEPPRREPQERPVCKGDRPIGTFPNCCPRGTHFARGACRRDTDNGKDGNGGTQGNTGPTEPPVCEGRRPVGTFPNCCPRGMHYERGACRPDTGTGGATPSKGNDDKCTRGIVGCRPKQPCTGGRIGTPPNCSCPPGTHETRSGQCETNASPTKETPKSEPSKGKCTGGQLGTPPNCFCPPPTKFIGRRCRLVSKPTPTPTPTGPSPKKQCSGGKVPRVPDGVCVCPGGTTDRGGQCVDAVR